MSFHYIVWSLLAPSSLLFAALIASALLFLARRPRPARFILFGVGFAIVLLAILPMGTWLLAPLEDRFPESPLPDRVDGIIILAGSEQPHQSAAHVFPQFNDHSERVMAGLLLARRYPGARVVHSGRTPVFEDPDSGHELTAPQVARAYFVAAGLDESRLLLDEVSTDTCESPRALRQHLTPQPSEVWLLVTSAVHMPRAVGCFRAADWPVTPVPVDFQQGTGSFNPFSRSLVSSLQAVDLAAHEWIGLLYYRLWGKTNELFPGP